MIPYNFNNAPLWDNNLFKEILSTTAPTSIRLNPDKKPNTAKYLLIDKQVPWCANGFYLSERPVFTLDPALHAGAYYVQEASSMFIAQAFNHCKQLLPDTPLHVLDLCAAPGGKSTLLASYLNEDDLLISNEVIQSRATILEENITRWGKMNTWVTNNDPKNIANAGIQFDIILIDAPCSGSGLWRRDPKAMDEWSPEHVQLCADRQKRILADILPSLKPNGILIYSTCSYSIEENEQVSDWITHSFQLNNIQIPIEQSWNIVTTNSPQHGNFGYRFYPWNIQGEGFFCTVFQNNKEAEMPINKKYDKSVKSNSIKKELKDEIKIWADWVESKFDLVKGGETTFALNPNHINLFQSLQKKLKIKKAGTALGKIAHNTIIPTHDLAMSIHLKKDIPLVNVALNEALIYLKKESIKTSEGLKGLHAVAYEGQILGWGKWMPNRMNNYLPNGLRIRMDVSEHI